MPLVSEYGNHLNFCHSLGRVFWIHFQSSRMPLMLPPAPISCPVDFKGFLNVPFSFNQFRLQLIKFQQKESLFSIFEGSPALPSSVTTYIISHQLPLLTFTHIHFLSGHPRLIYLPFDEEHSDLNVSLVPNRHFRDPVSLQ